MNKLSRSFSLLAWVVFSLSACQTSVESEGPIGSDPLESGSQVVLTLDDAINEVNHLLEAINPTRSNGKTIGKCFTITKGFKQARSANEPNTSSLPEEASVYIVNFENDQGYALIAADPNAPSTILALTDTGFLDPNQTQDNPGLIMYLANMETQLNTISPPMHASYGPWCYQSMGGVMCHNVWGQRDPYNLFAPLIDGNMPPAGCTATALAQLLTIYDYPKEYNGYKFEWDEMEKQMQVYLGNPRESYPPAHEMIGRLFEQISLPCNLDMQFGLSGSGASLYQVPRTMANLGFSNPGTYKEYYDTEEVKQALLDFYPVLVTGYAYEITRSSESGQDRYLGISIDKRNITYSGGHTWLVDQLVRMSRTVTVTSADGKRTSFEQESELIHCNFGWNGASNGLYYSGAFDTSNGCVEPLSTNGTAGNYQYYMQSYYGAIK